MAINILGDKIESLLDISIVYPDGYPPTSTYGWRITKIGVNVVEVPIPHWVRSGNYEDDPVFRDQFTQWVNELWLQKIKPLASCSKPCQHLHSKAEMPMNTPQKQHLELTNHDKISISYDLFMLGIILLSLSLLVIDYFLMGHVSTVLASWTNLSGLLSTYRNQYHLYVAPIDQWVTLFLIAEVVFTGALPLFRKPITAGFFFSFARWYDVIGCVPMFRALRLIRVVTIGYKLHQLGYNIIPPAG